MEDVGFLKNLGNDDLEAKKQFWNKNSQYYNFIDDNDHDEGV